LTTISAILSGALLSRKASARDAPDSEIAFTDLIGQTLRFETETVGAGASVSSIKQGERVLVLAEPIPTEQTVTITAGKARLGRQGFELSARSRIANPRHGENPYEKPFLDNTVTAFIDETGKISDIETVSRMGGNINTNHETELGYTATLCHFFGRWMLDVAPGWSDERTIGSYRIVTAVEATESVGEEPCFRISQTHLQNGNPASEIQYWVSSRWRVALAVSGPGQKMEVVS
jgi:hypothetical protein